MYLYCIISPLLWVVISVGGCCGGEPSRVGDLGLVVSGVAQVISEQGSRAGATQGPPRLTSPLLLAALRKVGAYDPPRLTVAPNDSSGFVEGATVLVEQVP